MDSDGPQLVSNGPGFEAAGLVHRVLRPETPSPYPTLIMLHGRSGDENAMWIFSRVVPKNWLVLSPRGIKPDPAGGFAWHPRQRDEWPPLDKFDNAVKAVKKFVDALPTLYNADISRLYLMGFSQGAATSYAFAMRHRGLVKGLAGLVGFVPVGCGAAIETAALKDVPIFMAVGKRDIYIAHTRAQNCAQTLQAAGAELSYHEYDTGHRLNAAGMKDLKAWWLQQEQISEAIL